MVPSHSQLLPRIGPQVAHAPHRLVSIRSVDEAVVIGAALSMSSSAFVLQLLRERGELTTRFGGATLGVLLFQVSLRLPVPQPIRRAARRRPLITVYSAMY
jgi:hypothetical protein